VPLDNIHNEKELLQKVAQGSRGAFRSLYEHYYPLVKYYISLFEPSRENSDELTQDVFIRVWDKRDKLSGVESFKGYLFLMTRNLVFNYIRAMKVRRKLQVLEAGDGLAVNDLEDELLFRQYYNIAHEAIEKLPDGRRQVLKMSIEQGLSLDEIAEQLNISKSGVKKQLYAATAFVRQYLLERAEISVLLFIFLSLFEY